MNPQIPIEARQTVLDFVVAGTSFTAYEVTLEVRRCLGASVDVPHGEVNNIVQAMFAGGQIIGYDRRPDPQIQAATKPFRYYQIGGAVAAPFVAPVAPAIARSNLPAALRFKGDLRDALLRGYGLAARDFQIAAGAPAEPFAVWIPSAKEPTFRVRCYGAGWSQSEIERVFTLDPNPSADDLRWLSALAYADEFRVYSNLGGAQQQFLVALAPNMVGTVTKEAERATGEPDGLQIEVAIQARENTPAFLEQAYASYRHFRVPPRIYYKGQTAQIPPQAPLLSGANWALADAKFPYAIVDEVAYPIGSISELSGIGVDLDIAAGELDVDARREGLNLTSRTRAALYAAFRRFNAELIVALNERIEGAANLWEAKIIFGEMSRQMTATYDNFARLVSGKIFWRGIALGNGDFTWNLAGVTARRYLPTSRPNKIVASAKVSSIAAQPNTLIFIDDLSQSATSRLAELYQTAPFEAAYVLSFDDDQARANFYRQLNFDSVPTRLLSELPNPARAQTPSTPSNRRPFDANLHSPQAPTNPLVAAFAAGDSGGEADFERLKKWARECDLDGNNWPDWKRLYKSIEAQLWPPQGRFRWDKTEADFPSAPLPSERQLEVLGVLMGRLDSENARDAARNQSAPTLAQRAIGAVGNLLGRNPTPIYNGPSAETLAYLKRRAMRLLVFLRDRDDLSDARRVALAPLVCGLMQREQCLDVNATLPLRLKLDETEILADNPGAIERVWQGDSLPLTILKWAYEWLDNHGVSPRVSVAQLRRFAEFPDVDWTLKLAPAVLESGQNWPSNWNLAHFARVMQGNLSGTVNSQWSNTQFLARHNDVLSVFARFPQLPLDDRWLRESLSEVTDETTLDWLAPRLQNWAQNGELELIERMSPALQNRFNDAIVAARPNGLSLEQWRQLVAAPARAERLAPALRQLPLSDEAATFLWALAPAERAPMFAALGDNPAIAPLIRGHAAQLDWAFAAPLSLLQWELFALAVAQSGADLSAADWDKIADLPFQSGHQFLPLGAGFWEFFFGQETRLEWLERVGRERAAVDFAGQDAATFERLLNADATGLEMLGDTWLDANQGAMARDGELILQLAQSARSGWQARALRVLAEAPLSLPVALRLMESGLPRLEEAARPFWENAEGDWSARVLALADSPNRAARAWALEMLERFPDRWTPILLQSLAEHDDKGVRAFVAQRLKAAPPETVQSEAVAAFDSAILNARGQARQAKNSVQERLTGAEILDVEALLEAARNGAPRDRAWALGQLVRASLNGAQVEDLEVEGAVARAVRKNASVS